MHGGAWHSRTRNRVAMVNPQFKKYNLMVGLARERTEIKGSFRDSITLGKHDTGGSNEVEGNGGMSNHMRKNPVDDKAMSVKERKLVGLKKKPRYWTDEEDRLLENAVEAVKREGNPKHAGDNMWKKVSAYVPNRAWRECLQRWTKVLVPGLKKGKWSPTEDDTLLALVNAQIKINPLKICWPEVSKGMGYRSCKQCRERWINHLDPNVKKGDWTAKEDEILLRIGEQFPAKWAKIARHIPGRTENTVKVRWKILKRQEWKPDEDRELLRLTAMYPRQWRTIANKLPGRNERNVKQRLHVLSKEKPEAFSFLENLPSPKVHKKGNLGKKRSSPGKPKSSIQKNKRQRVSEKVRLPPTTLPSKAATLNGSPQKQEKENGRDGDLSKPRTQPNGLDMLLQTATQAQPQNGISAATNTLDLASQKPSKPTAGPMTTPATQPTQTQAQVPLATTPTATAAATAAATVTAATAAASAPAQAQLPHLDSPTLGPMNPFGMLTQSPFQYVVPLGGAQALNQTPLPPGLPFLGQMPFVYNDPTTAMAYMASLSAQLNLLKQNNKATTDKTSNT